MHGVKILAGLGVLIDLGDMFETHAFLHFFHGSVDLLEFLCWCRSALMTRFISSTAAVGDDDEDGCKGAGKAVGALLGKLVDLHGDEQELRRHEQDDRGDSGYATHEGRDEAC